MTLKGFGGLMAVGLALAMPTAAEAGVVMNNNDAGAGSLRQAIIDAGPGETITFDPSVTGTITLTSAELQVFNNLSIVGPGANVLRISGNSTHRVFNLSGNVTISGLAIESGRLSAGNGANVTANGGNAILTTDGMHVVVGPGAAGPPAQGAGIFISSGNVVLDRVAVHGNQLTPGSGGTATATGGDGGDGLNVGPDPGGAGGNGTAIAGNGGAALGAGIYQAGGNLTIRGSTIDANQINSAAGGSAFATSGDGGDGATIANNDGGPGGTANAIGGFEGPARGAGLFVAVGGVLIENSTISGNAIAGHTAGTSTPVNGANGTSHGLPGGDGGAHGFAIATPGPTNIETGAGLTFESSIAPVVNNTTIDANTLPAGGHGANLYTSNPPLHLASSIVVNPAVPAAGNCVIQGANIVGGGNIFSDSSCTAGVADLVVPGVFQLGPLQLNGGTTKTQALAKSSPAIDFGRQVGLSTDQRGSARTSDVASIPNAAGGDGTDSGAYELVSDEPPPQGPQPQGPQPPETTFDKVPKNKVKSKKVTYLFESSDPAATFACQVDKKPFKPCTSPFKLKKLKKGKHSVQVQASGAGGTDSSPASDSFKRK